MRDIPPCRAAWQEILVPEKFRPFYVDAAVWHSGQLFLLSVRYDAPRLSRQNGLVYDPQHGFTAMSEMALPDLGALVAAVPVGNQIAFVGAVDESGLYDVTTNTWSTLPSPPDAGYVRGALSLDNLLALSYDHAPPKRPDAPPYFEAQYFTFAPGDETLTETSQPTVPDWHAPAMTWTGSEILAWGGENSRQEPTHAAMRYDPASDTWRTMSVRDAPSGPGGGILWTDPEAVAWDEDWASGGRYDPALDHWRPVSPPPSAGLGHPAIVARGKVVSWTGTTSTSEPLTVYDPSRDAWLPVRSSCTPLPRRDPLLIWADDGLIVWGGKADCDSKADPTCADSEFQRAFFIPAAVLFDELHDVGECTCSARE